MNHMRTAILLAGLSGLFMAVGYLIGGMAGAVIALVVAAATYQTAAIGAFFAGASSVRSPPSMMISP